MILIVNKEDGSLLNIPSLLNGDMESSTYLDTCRNIEGNVIIPDGIEVIEKNNDFYDFSSDHPDDGYLYKYYYQNGKISAKMTLDEWAVNDRINAYKKELEEGDYKITKCYEAYMLSETIPYDIVSLHDERQILRDKINNLQTLLN